MFPYYAAIQGRRRVMGLGSFGDDPNAGLDFLNADGNAGDPIIQNLSYDNTAQITNSAPASASSAAADSSGLWTAAGQILGGVAKSFVPGTPGAPAAVKPAATTSWLSGTSGLALLAAGGIAAVLLLKKH